VVPFPSVADLVPDSDSIRSVDPYPDPDPGGQKRPIKVEKNLEISCFEVLDVLFEVWREASSVTWTSFMVARDKYVQCSF
jgi:hypothetical protein